MLIAALAYNVAGYLGVNALMAERGIAYSVAVPWDFQIPFLKYFSPIYGIVYFIPVISFFVCWKNYEVVKAGFKSFMGAATICLLSYLLFPVEFTDRIQLAPPFDFFENVVRFFYWIDRPYNCFPSLHVALAFISVQMIDRYNPRLAPYFLSLALLVTLSTLFVRQHYILDLVAGGGLAYLMGWLFIPKELAERAVLAEEAV